MVEEAASMTCLPRIVVPGHGDCHLGKHRARRQLAALARTQQQLHDRLLELAPPIATSSIMLESSRTGVTSGRLARARSGRGAS
jgi:hypothetical protein